MKIYIVNGATGEYSDQDDWVVCAYRDRALADAHVHDAMIRAKEIEKSGSRYEQKKGENEFDPNMRMDYTGTKYYVVETELKNKR
jgi:hypothetical protein